MKLSKEAIQSLSDSTTVTEAMFAAQGYYQGMGDPLYKLMCGIFDEWDLDDLESVAVAVSGMADDVHLQADEEFYDGAGQWEPAFLEILEAERKLQGVEA